MSKKDQLSQTLTIRDLETLKVIADPLRMQILEILIIESLTVKQAAEKLGLSPNKLYYHINLLEKHGLIQVSETRLVANMIEKTYRAVASSIDIDPELLAFSTPEGKQNINQLLVANIDATRDDILRSLEARAFELEKGAQEQPRRAIITRNLSRLPEDEANEFLARLSQLLQDFEDANTKHEDGLQTYALTVAFYPSFYYQANQSSSEADST